MKNRWQITLDSNDTRELVDEPITDNVRMPSDEVRIVAMQPYIQFHSTTEEPFRWADNAVEEQLIAINRTLDIALNNSEGCFANFTLFPEYSIPGIVGATAINDRISADAWPNDSIIIAGIDGITKEEYSNLCDLLTGSVSESNAPNSVGDTQWVNCCVIWIKNHEGGIDKYVQPKIRPAWPEMNATCNDMFSGSTVYLFECQYEPSGYPCRFLTLICYDWVASVAGTTVCHEFLDKLTELKTPNPTSLDWTFVVQHNPGVNHTSFLNSTFQFLTDVAHPFVERDKAIVVHANTAVSQRPTRTGLGGFSSCVFSPSAQFNCECCRPTVCLQPQSLRGSDILKRCKDVVFREMGECVHSFTVRVPRFVTPDATDKTYPLPSASVYNFRESDDPRLSGGPIPASVKWVNDSLDLVERLSTTALDGRPLRMDAETVESAIIGSIRQYDGHAASDSVNWATCSLSHGEETSNEKHRLNVDLWGAEETASLEHVLHSLTSLGLAYNLDFESGVLHGTMQNGDDYFQIVAIRGYTHQDCRRHYDKFAPEHGTDSVLVIARDRDNLVAMPEEYWRIDETPGERGLAFLDYQTLIRKCRESADSNILKGYLDDILPRNNRII